MATIQRLGRNSAASTMARSSAGKAIIRSVKRISTVAMKPRKNPAVTPTSAPMATASPLATMPMTRDVRAPQMRRERRSRPSRSVPSRNVAFGGSGAPSSVSPSKNLLGGIVRRDQRRRRGRERDEHDHSQAEGRERAADQTGEDAGGRRAGLESARRGSDRGVTVIARGVFRMRRSWRKRSACPWPGRQCPPQSGGRRSGACTAQL